MSASQEGGRCTFTMIAGFDRRALMYTSLVRPQITRVNKITATREAKIKAGEKVPESTSEQVSVVWS